MIRTDKGICETCLHRAVCGKYKATGGVDKCEHHAEERHGRWILTDYKPFLYIKCSLCGRRELIGHETAYCPYCGTPMDGGNDDG